MADKKMHFGSMEELMGMAMADIADLPTNEAPPSGNYNLTMKAEIKVPEEAGKNPYVAVEFTIDAINDINAIDEQAEDGVESVKIGHKWTERFHPFTKQSTANAWGVMFLKALLRPVEKHFGLQTLGECIAACNEGIAINATVKRKVRKDDAGEEKITAEIKEMMIL